MTQIQGNLQATLVLHAYLGLKPEGTTLETVPTARVLFDAVATAYHSRVSPFSGESGARLDQHPQEYAHQAIAEKMSRWLPAGASFPKLSGSETPNAYFDLLDDMVQGALSVHRDEVTELAQTLLESSPTRLEAKNAIGTTETFTVVEFLTGAADTFVLKGVREAGIFARHRDASNLEATLRSIETSAAVPERLHPLVLEKVQELRGQAAR